MALMEPYALIDGAGPVASSADLFTTLVEELQCAEAAVEAARGSFEAAHAAITRRCGPVIGKRQVEQAVVSSAGDIAAFYAARIPEPCTVSTLLVISADAKGIVMRPGALRPATAKAAARESRMRTRLAAGEKPSRKRMATLACVYDAEPSPRRPHDIIARPAAGTATARRGPGPKRQRNG